jgi:hypothetical protein
VVGDPLKACRQTGLGGGTRTFRSAHKASWNGLQAWDQTECPVDQRPQGSARATDGWRLTVQSAPRSKRRACEDQRWTPNRAQPRRQVDRPQFTREQAHRHLAVDLDAELLLQSSILSVLVLLGRDWVVIFQVPLQHHRGERIDLVTRATRHDCCCKSDFPAGDFSIAPREESRPGAVALGA